MRTRRCLDSRREMITAASLNLNAPPVTTGLVFWGTPQSSRTSVTSGAIDTLGDESGNGRDFVQATAGKRPTFNAADSAFGGRPSMTFAAASSQCLGRAAGLPAMATVSVYFVVRGMAQVGGGQRLFDISPLGSAGGLACYNPPTSSVIEMRFDSDATHVSDRRMTVVMADPNILAYIGNLTSGGSLWTTYLNGVASGTSPDSAAGAGISSGTGASSIASVSGGGSSFCSMTMSDILVYSASHSASNVASVYAWLKARNGL